MKNRPLNPQSLWIVQVAQRLSDKVVHQSRYWGGYATRSLGQQLVRSADSVGANIVEGYGRHHKQDALRFYYISRGSLEETIYWLRAAVSRKWMEEKKGSQLIAEYLKLSKSLQRFIQFHQNQQRD